MAYREALAALTLIVTASPTVAGQPDPAVPAGAPMAPPEAKYCMHVGPLTGSLVETVRCWTREEWAEQGVDVDKEWAKEGVEVKS